MKESVNFGINKSGIKMAPLLTKEMLKGTEEFLTKPLDTSVTAADIKKEYVVKAGPVGTVPMPSTVKGVVNTGIQMIKGNRPEILLDKLGERLAFERSGVRLYDAMILKCEVAVEDKKLDTDTLALLREFREEEAKHFKILRNLIEEIGGDPTAQTPCADVSGVAGIGLVQAMNDPRTSIQQCAGILLMAELIDKDGWDLLIEIVEDAGLTDEVVEFRKAQVEEEKHLSHVRIWVRNMLQTNDSEDLH